MGRINQLKYKTMKKLLLILMLNLFVGCGIKQMKKDVGEILGWLITANIDYIDSAKMTTLSTRIGTVIFKFDEENEIVAQGSTIYHHGHRQMKPGIPQSRAIVGGTGKYKGVEGQILSTRNDDRTYTHVFDMKLED
jgi:hypothetical protein